WSRSYRARFSFVHIGGSSNQAAYIRITTDSSESRSFETDTKRQAKEAGIPTASIDDIVAMGDKIDIIFDLTGIPDVRRELREKLVAAKNGNTVIASETIARFIWSLISDDELPLIEGRKMGY
ncbi:MAG: hypothetical protein ACLPSW_00070, partial [Roseiarcus sp.]